MGTVDLASNEVTVKSMPTSPGTVKLSGVMIDKCPVSGCWFHLKDKTGIIKVDLKATNFTSTPIPVNSKVNVYGKYASGDDSRLVAVGIEY